MVEDERQCDLLDENMIEIQKQLFEGNYLIDRLNNSPKNNNEIPHNHNKLSPKQSLQDISSSFDSHTSNVNHIDSMAVFDLSEDEGSITPKVSIVLYASNGVATLMRLIYCIYLSCDSVSVSYCNDTVCLHC